MSFVFPAPTPEVFTAAEDTPEDPDPSVDPPDPVAGVAGRERSYTDVDGVVRVHVGERDRDREFERRIVLAESANESAREWDRTGDPARDRARPRLSNATLPEASACIAPRPCAAAGL